MFLIPHKKINYRTDNLHFVCMQIPRVNPKPQITQARAPQKKLSLKSPPLMISDNVRKEKKRLHEISAKYIYIMSESKPCDNYPFVGEEEYSWKKTLLLVARWDYPGKCCHLYSMVELRTNFSWWGKRNPQSICRSPKRNSNAPVFVRVGCYRWSRKDRVIFLFRQSRLNFLIRNFKNLRAWVTIVEISTKLKNILI